MDDKQAIGKLGENKAAEYLVKKGFEIVERNFRFRRGEIDLIARKGQLLLFVEVKARTGSAAWGYPEEAVDHKKVQQIIRCANGYIFQADWQGEIRFDIIAVEMGKDIKVTHFEDAFH